MRWGESQVRRRGGEGEQQRRAPAAQAETRKSQQWKQKAQSGVGAQACSAWSQSLRRGCSWVSRGGFLCVGSSPGTRQPQLAVSGMNLFLSLACPASSANPESRGEPQGRARSVSDGPTWRGKYLSGGPEDHVACLTSLPSLPLACLSLQTAGSSAAITFWKFGFFTRSCNAGICLPQLRGSVHLLQSPRRPSNHTPIPIPIHVPSLFQTRQLIQTISFSLFYPEPSIGCALPLRRRWPAVSSRPPSARI